MKIITRMVEAAIIAQAKDVLAINSQKQDSYK